MSILLTTLLVLLYLLWSLSGFFAVLLFFIKPHRDYYWGEVHQTDGLDVSWCELIVMALSALIPIINFSMNLFWLWHLRQKINRCPLIQWPKVKFPKIPKCGIAVKGRPASK